MGYREVSEPTKATVAQAPRFEQLIRKQFQQTPPKPQPNPLPTKVIFTRMARPNPAAEEPAPAPVVTKAAIASYDLQDLFVTKPSARTIIPGVPSSPTIVEPPEHIVWDEPAEPEPAFEPISEPAVMDAVVQNPVMFNEFADTEAIYRRPFIPPAAYVPDAPVKQAYSISIPRFALPKLQFNYGRGIIWTFFVVRLALAVALVYFGLSATGSYFGTQAGWFEGQWAILFYKYQFGTLLTVIGALVGYDTLRFRIKQ